MLIRNNYGKIKIVERNNFIDDKTYNSYIYLLNYQTYKKFDNIKINKSKQRTKENNNYSLSVINDFLADNFVEKINTN